MNSQDLAIFRGVPSFASPLHVGRPNLGDRKAFQRRLDSVMDGGWLTNNGPLLQEFERRIAEFVGGGHCVAMCNATVALEILIRALGLHGEVIIPSFTFVATAHALQWQEITPVFCDLDPLTHNIDPSQIAKLITPRTSGIIGVHVWGRPCPVEALSKLADSHSLELIFDAAHAFGCTHNGKQIGRFGHAEVFSFHATKFVHSFEGGAVVTEDLALANKLRLMRNFGFSGYDNVVYLGTNGKMSEISAAMGLTSLDSVATFIACNRRNYIQYRDELEGVPGVKVMHYDDNEASNFQYLVLEVDHHRSRISRDLLLEVLWAENVYARKYFYPGCHRMEPYRSYYPNVNLLLPCTEELVTRVMLLPTGTSVGEAEIRTVCSILRTTVTDADAVVARLEARVESRRQASEAVVDGGEET